MRAVIHIGAPKTGTTALQGRLAANACALHQAGILYPRTGRDFGAKPGIRQIGFRFAMKGTKGPADGQMDRLNLSSPEARAQYADNFTRAFDAEIAASEPDTVVISDEALFRLADTETVSRASAFLRTRFDSVQIVCFLRDPINYVRGKLSQQAKMGILTAIDLDDLLDGKLGEGIYLPALDRWSTCFSPDEMTVQIQRGDVTEQMSAWLGGVKLTRDAETGDNQSLTALGLDYLIELNKRFPSGTRPAIIRQAFAQNMTGTPFHLSLDDQHKIWVRFECERAEILSRFVCNEADARTIRRDWVPGTTLQEDDPENGHLVKETCDLIEFLASEHAAQKDGLAKLEARNSAEVSDLKAELAAKKAEIARLKSN